MPRFPCATQGVLIPSHRNGYWFPQFRPEGTLGAMGPVGSTCSGSDLSDFPSKAFSVTNDRSYFVLPPGGSKLLRDTPEAGSAATEHDLYAEPFLVFVPPDAPGATPTRMLALLDWKRSKRGS